MTTITCQNLQPWIDSQFVEQRLLTLRVSPIKPVSPTAVEFAPLSFFTGEKRYTNDSQEVDSVLGKSQAGGWSSIQSLFCGSQECEKSNFSRYDELPFSSMSEASLNMCTEIIGNENGTAFPDGNTLFLSSLSSIPSSAFFEAETEMSDSSTSLPDVMRSTCADNMDFQKVRTQLCPKKTNVSDFPPPLSSLSRSNSLRMLPHREEGRLVVEALRSPATNNEFEVERSNGRVQLSMLTHFAVAIASSIENTADESSETVELRLEYEHGAACSDYSGEGYSDRYNADERYEVEGEAPMVWEDSSVVPDMGTRPETELDDYNRKPSRCKDGELYNRVVWQRFPVAT